MIVVDSSVWISHLRGLDTPAVAALALLIDRDDDRILIGDLILLELLQGARDEIHAARIELGLRAYPIAPMLSPELAVAAARFYRALRSRGITVRKTADLIIGAFCLTHGHTLLHDDRDFDPMEAFLSLRVMRG